MRYLVTVILLVFSNAYSQDFVLTGSLLGFEDGTRIILNPYLDNMEIDMDDESVILLKDGKFEFPRHLDKPTKFSLRVRPIKQDNFIEFEDLTFWAENVPMVLHGRKGEIFQSSIQGSLIQNQYFQYISGIANLKNLTKQIADSVKTLPNLGNEKKSEMRVRNHEAYKTIEEKRMEFIFNNPDYYCSAAELVFFVTFTPDKIDRKSLKEFYARMSPLEQSNIYGKQIGNLLKKDLETGRVQSLEVGDYPYNFILKDISGKEVKFSSINNKVILLDFWSSGCGPCRLEHKNYLSLYNEFRNNGFEIISVSQDQSKKKMREAISKDGMSWICLWDESKKVSNDYNISAIPANYLIIDGKVEAIDLIGAELRQKLEYVLSKNKN